VVGEVVGDLFVQNWLRGKLTDPDSLRILSKEDADKLKAENEALKARGVDVAKLTAGMAAAFAGLDVTTAAKTGGNAAEHNVLPLIILGGMVALELIDKGIQTYNAWQFAKAIQEGDTAKAEEYGTELALSLGTDAIAGNAAFLKMLKGFGLVALSTKIGQKVEKVAVAVASEAKFANQKLLTRHFKKHGADFGAKSVAEYEKMASDFMTKPKPQGVLEKVRPSDGALVRYNPKAEEFGILGNSGVMRTYYKPSPSAHKYKTNLEYFNAQK
jgi:hypothetical protein